MAPVLLAAAALAASAPGVTVVSGSVSVKPDKITPLTVSCPAGTVAASGGVSHPLQGIDVLRSMPAGPGSWQFRILTQDGVSGSIGATAVCLRGHVRARTVRRAAMSNGRVKVAFGCPKGYDAVGAGWSYGPAQDAFQGFYGWVLWRIDSGWTVVASDLAFDSRSPSRTLSVVGRCVSGLSRRLERITFPLRIHTKENVVARSCRGKGFRAIAGGFAIADGDFFEGFSVTPSFGGQWSLYSTGSGRHPLTVSLLCLGEA